MKAALPGDIRLMNGVSAAVFVLAGAALAAAGVLALARSPWFPVRAIRLEGELQRINVTTVRSYAASRLKGNFFALDLGSAREAFEGVPWVRHAVVRRVWPDRLAVRLEEHRAVARWEGEDDNEKLVNSHGEVFDANVGDVEDEDLPLLAGPEGRSAQMLAMLARLRPLVERIDHELQELHLSGRGSWRAELDGELSLELGRGSDDEVVARVDRFVRTLPQVAAQYRSPLLHADLRHAEGYAVRLRGVTTTTAAASAAQRSN